MYNGIISRADFDNAVELFALAWQSSKREVMKAFRPTQSRIRLEQPAVTGLNNYKFAIKDGVSDPFNTEIRLKDQDIFVPTHVNFCLGNPTGDEDAAYKLFTYVNPFFFNVAMVAAYHGLLSIKVNKDQYVTNWPLWWHWHSPQTQQTLAAGAGSPVDQFNGDCDGFRSMQPFVMLSGQKNVQIEIDLPVAMTAVTANSRLIMIFDGVIFQNSTVTS